MITSLSKINTDKKENCKSISLVSIDINYKKC